MRVLVVDDDKLIYAALKTILESDEEITVADMAHNGKDAVDLFNKLRPDILLMDIRMDGMTGLEAGEAIYEITEDGEQELEDGSYELENGMTIEVEFGLIKSVKEGEEASITEEVELEFMNVNLVDGGTIFIVTEGEAPAVGDVVLDVEDGERVTDMTYHLDNGDTIVVVDGMISEIVKATEEVAAEFADGLPSAYIELPVGVHTIGENIYTVIEQVIDEGLESEYTYNVIESIVPVDVEEVEDIVAEVAELKEEFRALRDENKFLKAKFQKFAAEPSEDSTKTKVDFKKANKNERLKFYSNRK